MAFSGKDKLRNNLMGALRRMSPKIAKLDDAALRQLTSYVIQKNSANIESDYNDLNTKFGTDAKMNSQEGVYALYAENVVSQQYTSSIVDGYATVINEYNTRNQNNQIDFTPLGTDDLLTSTAGVATYPAGTSFDKGQASRGLGKPGDKAEGMGTVTGQMTLSKGVTENAGGGTLATIVDKGASGDQIVQGPQSVDVARAILRPQFLVAGGEEVRPNAQEEERSNILFETFSVVPDGYGLGPKNRLHLLNRQNDMLRFGAESLYEPRVDAPINAPRPIPYGLQESFTLKELEEAYATKIGMELLKSRGVSLVEKTPIGVLDDDMNRFPSSKGLKRQIRGPSPYEPVVFNIEDFLPARDPAPLQMNALDRVDSVKGTWGYRRKRVFDNIRAG